MNDVVWPTLTAFLLACGVQQTPVAMQLVLAGFVFQPVAWVMPLAESEAFLGRPAES